MATRFDYLITSGDADQPPTTTTWQAQTVTPTSNYTVHYITLMLKRSVTLVDAGATCTLSLADTTGATEFNPTTVLATSTINIVSLIGTAYSLITFTLSVPVVLTSGTTYAIVLKRDGTETGTLSWHSDADGGGVGYGSNTKNTCWQRSFDSGTAWSEFVGTDLLFEMWDDSGKELVGAIASASSNSGQLSLLYAIAGSPASESSLSGQFGSPQALVGILAGVSLLRLVRLQVPLGERIALIIARPSSYDPDKTWDEETKTWVSTRVIGPNSHKQTIIAVSELGVIYFGEV